MGKLILTTNSILLGRDVVLPSEPEVTSEDEGENFRKRQKYVLKCKQAAWKRFQHEYLVALRERHNLNHKGKQANIKIGDVVIIKGESKNRGTWKLAVVEKLHTGKDNVIRAVGLRTAKNYLERPIQLLYPMELYCSTRSKSKSNLNPNVEEFRPTRPKRTAAAVAKVRMQDIQEENDDI